ncbi:MAG: hypothetical protein ACJ749_16980 [Flavisolibacter sp.]
MKKLILPLAGVLIAISAVAFGVKQKEYKVKTTSGTYWIFNGDPNSQSDIGNDLKYSTAPDGQPTCASGNDLCNIFADPKVGDPNHPNLSTEVTTMRTFKN